MMTDDDALHPPTCSQGDDETSQTTKHNQPKGLACESTRAAASRRTFVPRHTKSSSGGSRRSLLTCHRAKRGKAAAATTSLSRHIGTFCSSLLVCAVVFVSSLFSPLSWTCLWGFRGRGLAFCNTTCPLPSPPLPPCQPQNTWCAGVAPFVGGAGACSFFAPPSALAKCWLRGLYTLPTHTHAHRTRLSALPRLHTAPRWCASRLRHVVWMVAASLAEGICTICFVLMALALLLCCVPLHRHLGPHTYGHNDPSPLAPAAVAWGCAPALCFLSGQQPARPFALVGYTSHSSFCWW